MSDNPVLAALEAFNKAHPHRQVLMTEEDIERARQELDELEVPTSSGSAPSDPGGVPALPDADPEHHPGTARPWWDR